MKILLLYKDKQVREVLAFSLESKFQLDVAYAEDVKTAIKRLDDPAEKVCLLIFGYKDFFSDVLLYRASKRQGFPSVAIIEKDSKELAKAKSSDTRLKFVLLTNLIENVYKAVEELITEKAIEGMNSESEFCRIKTNVLLLTSPLKGDVYIRLSPVKFLKLMRQGDDFNDEDLYKYTTKKKIDYLFLKTEDSVEFVLKLKEQIAALMRGEAALVPVIQLEQVGEGVQPETMSPDQVQPKKIVAVKKITLPQVLAKDPDSVHEVLHEMSHRLGFTKEVQELAKVSVQQAVDTMKRNPKLSSLLSKLKRDKEKYISSHSMLAGHIACALASQMTWTSEATYEKLTLASMLHDISLRNQELAAVSTLDDLEEKKGKFSQDEIEAYKSHPLYGAEIAKRFTEIPPDVDIIIAQHHERPDGTGFPRGVTHSRIGPLSTVFIVAHDIVHFLFSADVSKEFSKEQLMEFFEKYKDTYTFGNFKKILAVVPKLDSPAAEN
ncbi:MAG: hypothetical protein A3K03_03350 [Bdellovibrionales bacterium RIFOXYD1_FULL_44_7]|nr:MAG: hypothetical protein A3K03_03350 [Bdellovibrionales bacterium RIFOXYD1_FULL_44_7]